MFQIHIGLNRKLHFSALLASAFLVLIGFLAIFPVSLGHNFTNAATHTIVTSLTLSSSDIAIPFSVTSTDGSFSSASSDFSVTTNNATGYTLKIKAKDEDTDYTKLTNDNANVINSIESVTSENDFKNDASYNGHWGYRPSKLNSAENEDYLPAPNATGTTIDVTSEGNNEDNNYSIELGARLDFSTESGDYSNSYVLVAVANATTYYIDYDKNTTDDVTNLPASHGTNSMTATTLVLSTKIPTRENFTFEGWCDGTTTLNGRADTCDGTTYQPGDDISVDPAEDSGTTLYALWYRDEIACNSTATAIENAVCMQDMNANVIASMTTDEQYQLIDSRDNKNYYISKLQDGNVWMTENLNFDLNSNVILSSLDTNLTDTTSTAYQNGYSTDNGVIYWTPSTSTANVSSGTISNDDSTSAPRSSDPGTWYYTGQTLASGTQNYLAGTTGKYFNTKKDSTYDTHANVGNYYNWPAAVASNDVSSLATTTALENSICPANWKLPSIYTGPASNQNDCLNSTLAESNSTCYEYNDFYGPIYYYNNGGFYGGNNLELTPVFLTRTGTIRQGALANAGYEGYYWSNYTTSSNNSFEMTLRSSLSKVQDSYTRSYQRSVRCIAADATPSNSYALTEITFNGNGSTGNSYVKNSWETLPTQFIRQNASAKLYPNKYTRTNYVFKGWNTAADGSGTSYNNNANFSSDLASITLYAQWQEIAIIYDANGGTGTMTKTTGFDPGDSVNLTDNAFAKEGYTFAGWNTKPDGSGVSASCWSYDYSYRNCDFDTASVPAGTITLYAQWTNQITIHFEANGGSGEMPNQIVTQGEATALNANVFSGYEEVFDYWSGSEQGVICAESTGCEDGATITIPSGNIYTTIILNAEWTNQVTISFDANGGTGTMSDIPSNTIGDEISISGFNSLSREGYILDSFNTAADGSGTGATYDSTSGSFKFTVPTDVATKNLVLYAQWTNQVTIHFDANGGTGTMEDQIVTIGDATTINSNTFTKSGYVFDYWYTNTLNIETYEDKATITIPSTYNYRTITLSAEWTDQITISFDANGGEGSIADATVTIGSTWSYDPSSLQIYSADYILSSFNTIVNGTGTSTIYNSTNTTYDLTISETIAKNKHITLYAQWTNHVTLVFSKNDPDATGFMSSQTITVNNPTAIHSNTFTKPDYAFDQWRVTYVDGDHYYDNNDVITITGEDWWQTSITLYAEWTQQINVIFDGNGADSGSMNSISAEIGDTISFTYSNEFVRAGYKVDGFNPKVNGSGLGAEYNANTNTWTYSIPNVVADKNYKLYAQWTEVGPVTISFNGNGADSGSTASMSIELGSSDTLTANGFSRTGYTFSGWNTKADGSGISYTNGATFTVSAYETRSEITLYAQWSPNDSGSGSGGGSGGNNSGITIARAYELAYTQHGKGMYEETAYGNGVYEEVTDGNYKNFDVRFAMQDINMTYNDGTNDISVCDLITVLNDGYQALDTRDNKLYWITKTSNGKCWMTQNLDLDLNSTTTLNSTNTDLTHYNSTGYTNGYSQTGGIIYWTPSASTISVSSSSNIPNNDSLVSPRSTNVGNWYYTDQFLESSQQNYLAGNAGAYFSTTPFSGNGTHGHVGNYYNWTAAIASNNSTGVDNAGDSNSICPAGWRLPLASGEKYSIQGIDAPDNDFNDLINAYNDGTFSTSAGLESTPLYLNRVGTIRQGALANAGYDGYYWSSIGTSSTSSRNLIVRSNNLDPTNAYSGDRQRSIRCIAR